MFEKIIECYNFIHYRYADDANYVPNSQA